jgi:hypothetical protein
MLGSRDHYGPVSYPDATITRTFHSLPHICHEASCFTFVLETHDDVMGVAHNDDLAFSCSFFIGFDSSSSRRGPL